VVSAPSAFASHVRLSVEKAAAEAVPGGASLSASATMHTTARALLLAALGAAAGVLCAQQAPLALDDPLSAPPDVWRPPAPPRALRGRFLHVTDLHPDPFYLAGVAATHACHRARKAKKGAARSGAWGAPASGCDAPLRLVNATLAHLAREWADAVDFVVWTGDSARHDNDRRHPRTPREIYDLNRMVAGWMREAFTRRGIPVIPSIGVCP
jgi:endopolyphosphatase